MDRKEMQNTRLYLLGVLLAAIFWLVLRAAGKPCKES